MTEVAVSKERVKKCIKTCAVGAEKKQTNLRPNKKKSCLGLPNPT